MKALYVILLSTIIAFGNCQKAKDDNSTSKLLPFVFLGQKQNEINSIIVTYTLKNKEGEPLANVNVNSISTDSNQNLVRAAFKKPTKTDKDGICEVSYLYHQQTPTYKMEITDVFEKLIGGFNAITDPQKPLNITIENVNGMQVTVQKVVASGNLGSNTTPAVFNDTSAPIVSASNPTNGSQNILTTEPISITFNEAIDPSTVNKDTFAVKQNDTQIEGTYTVNSNEVTFKPKSDFSFNTTYTVTLSSSILDRAGNAMSLINFQFTTGASNDRTPPSINSTFPISNAVGVVLYPILTVTFNEPIDPASVNNSTITVTNNGISVNGTVAVNGSIVTFTPSTSLKGEPTTYTVTVSAGIKDRVGNATTGSYSWNFTTELYTILPTVNQPSFSLESGIYNSDQLVTITTTTSGANIYYTIDGSDPTTSSTQYSGAISISGHGTNRTIKAMAVKSGMVTSSIANTVYMINYNTVSTPTLNVPTGVYYGAQSVTISTTTTNAEIRYTTNGTDPSCSTGTVYSTAINIAVTSTVKSIACKTGMNPSTVITSIFTIPTYSIGGTITGLTASGLVLQNNNGDDLTVNSGATTFIFATKINSGTYSVTVKTQPTVLNCVVNNGSGTATYDVTSVNVTCTKVLGTVSTIAGTPGTAGSTDGTGTAAKFNQPHDVVSDGTNLYISDYVNYTVRKMVISTGVVTTLAGSAGLQGTTDGIGSYARFGGVVGMTLVGPDLYVADAMGHAIRKIITSTGQVITIAGTNVANSIDGYGTSASLNYPTYICDDGNNLYVAEGGSNTIRKIVIYNAYVSTLAGLAGSSGSIDGVGSNARFRFPAGITRIGSDLYITERDNHTIRKLGLYTGVVTTFAGSPGQVGSVDGVGTTARFNAPNGITGNNTDLYLVDMNNNTIRKIIIATGEVSTYAGSVGVSGTSNGIGSSALFNSPRKPTFVGNILYVTDLGNHTIRKIE